MLPTLYSTLRSSKKLPSVLKLSFPDFQNIKIFRNNMKLFIVLAFLAAATAAPNGYGLLHKSLPSYAAHPEIRQEVYQKEVPIVRFHFDNDHRGTFNLETVSGDGSTFNKQGQLKNLGGPDGPVSVMSGSYSFVEDGKTYLVNYVADEHGFRATGDHLPTPPPMPEAIRRSLHHSSF